MCAVCAWDGGGEVTSTRTLARADALFSVVGEHSEGGRRRLRTAQKDRKKRGGKGTEEEGTEITNKERNAKEMQ